MSSHSAFEDIEAALRAALAPIEPPEHLRTRMETTLGSLVELAGDEIDAWGLGAMKDPRHWAGAALGPPAAVLIGGGAAAGLVVLRTQRRRHKHRATSQGARDLAARTLRDVGREALRVFDELTPGR